MLSYNYGGGPGYWAIVPPNIKKIYLEQLVVIKAEEMYNAIIASSFSDMEKPQREDVMNDLKRRMSGGKATNPKHIDVSKLSEVGRKHFFAQQGISFEEVPAVSKNGHKEVVE